MPKGEPQWGSVHRRGPVDVQVTEPFQGSTTCGNRRSRMTRGSANPGLHDGSPLGFKETGGQPRRRQVAGCKTPRFWL